MFVIRKESGLKVKSSNRRKFTRINFDRQAKMEFVNGAFSGCRTKNISLTGIFAIGAFQQKMGEYCFINLSQSGMAGTLDLAATAKVVREDDEGLAIMFTSMPYESYMLLQLTLLGETTYPFDAAQILPDNSPFQVTGQW